MNHMMMNVFVVVELSRQMDTKKKESFIWCIVVVQLHDTDFLIFDVFVDMLFHVS